jgi:hypothetical protein
MVYKLNRERVNQPRSLPVIICQVAPLAKYRCATRYSAVTGAFGAANRLYFASSVPASEAFCM